MLKYLSVAFFLLFGLLLNGQEYLTKSDSDPKAKIKLDQLKERYETFRSLEVDFVLIIEYPGQSPEIQVGKMLQQEKMYVLDFPHQKIYNNGEHLWLHLKAAEEVQLYNASQFEDSEDGLDPDRLLRLYETGDYVYVISFEGQFEGKQVTQIEFKPLDRDSEYSKMRLIIDEKNQFPSELTVLSKDGSRYSLKINGFTENLKIDSSIFTFDEIANPDLYVEDLRM